MYGSHSSRWISNRRIPRLSSRPLVSPGQSVNQLVLGCLWYVEEGVQAALLVDPSHKSVLVFRPSAIPVGLSPGGTIDLSDIVPGLRLPVADIFDALRL
jgi:Uma2 family endonuclease